VHITGDPDDPERSPRVSIKWAREEIARWGRDNPWVMTNILGQFPAQSSDRLISTASVADAMERDLPALTRLDAAIIWGLDPARYGSDESALIRRQGQIARRSMSWRNLDGTDLGDAVGREIGEAEARGEGPDAVFVDVGGVGASAFDRLKANGWSMVQPVDFGGRASDGRFANKRTEMWWLMGEWVALSTSCLPSDPLLRDELVAPSFSYRVVNKTTALFLETKESMKKRGVPSPNRADALALTFASPVSPRGRAATQAATRNTKARVDYDPLERMI
jgi:hypothetical protein